MLRNNRFWGFLLILCLILIPMSIYQHAGSDVVEQNAPWYEFLGWFLEGSFNKPEHHGFLFLAMELLLLLQILPEVNEQRLVRMSRREHWRKTWAAMGIWGSDEGIWQTLNLMKDLRVYSAFYSDGGLDLFAYGLATVKHFLWIGLLYLGSLWIFEKRDILNGKK